LAFVLTRGMDELFAGSASTVVPDDVVDRDVVVSDDVIDRDVVAAVDDVLVVVVAADVVPGTGTTNTHRTFIHASAAAFTLLLFSHLISFHLI